MKSRLTLITMLLSTGLAFTACHSHKGPGKKAEKVVSVIKDKLELNESQTAKLEKIKTEFINQRKSRKGEKQEKINIVKQQVLATSLDDNIAKNLLKERHQQQEADFDKFYGLIKDFHSSLSPDQKKELLGLIEKMEKRFSRHL
ncbi:MAG: Spy/CpxP family protein refolding chaperone [Bdellovibrionota bacterium]|nr:Spy/CpxP family protein refolding chaperone [Bdellovibrionota bacterium]